MTSPAPRTDLPTIEEESRPFWDAAKEGRFLIGKCGNCGRVHHYPRPFCPTCWSEDVSLVEASGKATLYTYSTVYVNDLSPFRDELPYVAAMVELEEGPHVMSQLEDFDEAELKVGMPLAVKYRALTDDITIPVFAPAK